jgi:RNA polymerase sigma-70 factor (ECF subfamily)
VTPLRLLRPDSPRATSEIVGHVRDLDDAYRTYCRYVAAICLRISGRRSELEDLIQDVFAEAASTFDALREPAAIRGWLATIAVRVTRKRLYRRRFITLVGFAPPSEYEQIADLAASPYDRALVAAVYRVLDRLHPDDRIAFVLHLVEGERLEAVAALTGCSVTTAKRRIARAKAAIERRLSDD